MLLFNSKININKNLTPELFIQLVIEWNQKSLNDSNVIKNLKWNGEHNVYFGNPKLNLQIQEYKEKNIIAVRHEKIGEDGVVWDSDFIMNFDEMIFSVQLYRSYEENIPTIEMDFSTPHIITMLGDRGFLTKDLDLPVQRDPIVVNDDNLHIIADIMNGKNNFYLPVVYVSQNVYNKSPVDADWMSSHLKGVAHVLIQGDVRTNAQLRKLTHDNNEYYGMIGIYYPGSIHQHKRFLYHGYDNHDQQLLEQVVRDIIRYSNTKKIDSLYTWSGVSSQILRDKVNQHRDADELIQSFDDEIQNLRQRIWDLTNENDRLMYENQGLQNKLSGKDKVPLLYFGNEPEFFSGEIKEMILSILKDFFENSSKKSRRNHIADDIIKNNDFQNIMAERQNAFKRILKGYDGLSGTMRKELSDLGFVITDEGKHHKMVYYGDKRYWNPLANTPSDQRGIKNLISEVISNYM